MCATCDLVPLVNQAQFFIINTCGGVGPGWHPMLKAVIAACIRNTPALLFGQIKEKFGGLRIYTDTSTQRIDSLIAAAETLSFVICAQCGAPGRSRLGGWTNTLCEEHACASPSQTSYPS